MQLVCLAAALAAGEALGEPERVARRHRHEHAARLLALPASAQARAEAHLAPASPSLARATRARLQPLRDAPLRDLAEAQVTRPTCNLRAAAAAAADGPVQWISSPDAACAIQGVGRCAQRCMHARATAQTPLQPAVVLAVHCLLSLGLGDERAVATRGWRQNEPAQLARGLSNRLAVLSMV